LNTSDTPVNDELEKERLVIIQAKNNPDCFKPLYEKYYKTIFKFIYFKVLDKEVTADITSNVFIKALTNLHSYNFQNFPFSAWLYRIAYNEVMQFFRKHKKQEQLVMTDELLFKLKDQDEDIELDALKAKFQKIFERLKCNEVKLIELRFYEDLSYKEIGKVLGLNETNARVKIHRLLEKIRIQFKSVLR